MLKCSQCGETKPTSSFRKRSDTKRGYQYACKSCQKPDQRTAEVHWGRYIRYKYGISPDDYHGMLERQGGCCALCGVSECPSGRRFAVDHCHDTGVVRGILCYDCNTGLGKFRDNIEVLRRAADYVEFFHNP